MQDFDVEGYIRAWRAGGMPPSTDRVRLTVSSDRPRLGESVTLRWRAKPGATVRIYRGQALWLDDQDERGEVSITPLGIEPIRYRAEAGDATSECTIHAQVKRPVVRRFRLSAHELRVGEAVDVDYRVDDAQRLSFSVHRDGSSVQRIEVAPGRGSVRLPVDAPGRCQIRLEAFGEHAEFSADSVVQTHQDVRVSFPTASVDDFDTDRREAVIGEALPRLYWQVRDAKGVWLETAGQPDRKLALSGEMTLDPVSAPGDRAYVLRAINQGGDVVRRRLIVTYRYPNLEMALRSSEAVVVYGGTHELFWQVSGASSVSLHCSDLSRPLSKESAGSASICLHNDTQYLLVAVDMQGERHERRVDVAVSLIPPETRIDTDGLYLDLYSPHIGRALGVG